MPGKTFVCFLFLQNHTFNLFACPKSTDRACAPWVALKLN